MKLGEKLSEAIVCVDDEAILAFCLKQELNARYGDRYICEAAYNAEEALALVDELLAAGVRVAVIVTDWLMPGKKGDQLIAEVKQRCADAAAIMVSGRVDDETVSALREAFHPFAFIEKPWERNRLFAEIDGHVSKAG